MIKTCQHDQGLIVLSNTANATTIRGHPEARCEESAAAKAGDPHAREHDENAYGTVNAHGSRAPSPLHPSPFALFATIIIKLI